MIPAALILLFYPFGLRFVLTYRFTNRSVQAVLFRVLPVSSTRYDDVEEVRQVSFWEALLYIHALKAGNKVEGPTVLILRKRKLPVVITPDDPDGFVRELRRRVYQETGQWPMMS